LLAITPENEERNEKKFLKIREKNRTSSRN
jgi:hypothetical protein